MSSCNIFNNECCGQDESFWLKNPKDLFCSINPLPRGSVNSAKRLNAMTRMILYVSVLFFLLRYKYWHIFLGLGLFFIILLYSITNSNSTDIKMSKEYFDFVPSDNKVVDPNYLQSPLSLYTDTRSDMSSNITNSIHGSTNNLIRKQSGSPLKAKRDIEAGIQYYTPHLGTNPRSYVPPVIGSRIFDLEVWGKSSNVRPRTNFLKTRHITESELQLPDLAGNCTSLGVPIFYKPVVQGSVMPQNNLNQPTYDGYYPSEQNDTLGGMDERDFEATVLPTYHNPVQLQVPFEIVDKYSIPGYPAEMDESPLDNINEKMFDTQIKPTEKKPDEISASDAKKEYNTNSYI